ncbi:MAG: cytochrome oxidase small assembly protein [Burkholderiaceae bacterium]
MGGPAERRQRNLRTALILLSIALVFFLGVMAKYWLTGR